MAKVAKTVGVHVATHLVALLLAICCAADAQTGPLQVKNRFPLHLLFLTPRPTSPLIPAPGNLTAVVALDYSSIYFNEAEAGFAALMDMETTVVDTTVTYGLSPSTALTVEMPWVSMNAGFLDRFLEGYHDALGVPNYGREERPDNAFAYRVNKDGKTWFTGESGTLALADTTVSLQWAYKPKLKTNPWAGALVGRLKLPTGDHEKGYGSGRFDYGLSWTAARYGAPWSFYVMGGFAVHNAPKTQGASVRTRTSYSALTGVAYQYSDKTSWMLQFNGFTSPLQETGIDKIDRGALEVAVGCHYAISRKWTAAFAFCEDLSRAAPDFTVRLGLIWRFWSENAVSSVSGD